MDGRNLNLGLVTSFGAESFGEPGSRTFRLLATTHDGSVSLWLEKEQIVMLASALGDLLERVPESAGHEPNVDATAAFVGELEARVGSLGIGFDGARGAFTLEATELESPLGVEQVSLYASRDQFTETKKQLDEIVAAGRPRCPLCGTPLSDEPHFCPPSNGHARIASIE